MSDIVERLRDAASNPAIWTLTQEAADEIERLRAELAGMTAAWRNACERGDKAVAETATLKALLRESTPYMDYRRCPSDLINRIFAALGEDNEPVQKEPAED